MSASLPNEQVVESDALAARSALGPFGRTFSALRYPDFRFLWLGAFTSTCGTFMQALAQAWLVYTITGSAFLLGSHQGGDVHVNLGVIAAYTVAHIAAFIMAGIILVAVAEMVERTPQFLAIAGMFCILLEVLVVATLALGAEWALGTIGLWAVVIGNVLAVTAMGWNIWRTHPVLRRRLLHEPFQVRV